MGVTAYDIITDKKLLGRQFVNPSFDPVKTLLLSVDGLPMNREQAEFYYDLTGRSTLPDGPYREVWFIGGRRSWKTYLLAMQAVACLFQDYSPYLSLGERATVTIISQNKDQAKNCMDYILGILEQLPMLEALITKQNTEVIEFSNSISIAIRTASWRSTRGYAIPCLLLDELAFWRSEESANPDREIVNALRPSMVQFPNSRIFAASSPYAKRGELYRMHKKYFGVDDPRTLVWQSSTRLMNPTVTEEEIAWQYADDPGRAKAEYGGEFREDRQNIFTLEILEERYTPGVHEIAPESEISYRSAFDAAGGTGDDSAAGAIGHEEDGTLVLDAVREYKPPFDPGVITEEFCKLLKSYRLSEVHGDKYGGDWVGGEFRKHGILYEQSNKSKSELYQDLLPLVNSGSVELLDSPTLITQLTLLERRTGRGPIKIDHPGGCHDDVANAVALAFDLFRDEGTDLILFGEYGNIAQTPKSLEYAADEEERIQRRRAEERELRASGGDIFGQSVLKKNLW